MNLFAIISSLILVTLSLCNAQEPPKSVIKGQAATDAAILIWDPIENVTHYYVSLSNGDSKHITNNQVIFNNLTASTQYTATVSVADDYGNIYYELGEITFKTLLPKVNNLHVKYAGEDKIELIWDERTDAVGYSIIVKNHKHELIHPTLSLRENKVTVSDLKPASHYYIYVIVLGHHGESEPAIITGRTDGTGFKVNFWAGEYGDVSGGELTVYRPLYVPIGPYPIKVNFGCPIIKVVVWNAQFDEEASDLYTGMVVAQQKLQWEKQKTMIMMNFYPEHGNGSYCELTNTSIEVFFGDDALIAAGLDNQPTENTDIKVKSYEWLTTNRFAPKQAGLVQIMLKETYNNSGLKDGFHKPDEGNYIIAVNAGDECSGGLVINKPWGMTQKSSAGMVGATPQTVYFVQTGNNYHSNEPGFVYGYDPEDCTERKHITAQVMKGGPFVRAVLDAEDVIYEH